MIDQDPFPALIEASQAWHACIVCLFCPETGKAIFFFFCSVISPTTGTGVLPPILTNGVVAEPKIPVVTNR